MISESKYQEQLPNLLTHLGESGLNELNIHPRFYDVYEEARSRGDVVLTTSPDGEVWVTPVDQPLVVE